MSPSARCSVIKFNFAQFHIDESMQTMSTQIAALGFIAGDSAASQAHALPGSGFVPQMSLLRHNCIAGSLQQTSACSSG